MKKSSVRLLGVAVLVGTAVALSACSGTTKPTQVPSPTPPPPPVTSIVMQASVDSLPVDYVFGRYFSTLGTGTIDVTVDWTFAEDVVYVWVAKGQCTFEQFDADTCEYLTQSLTSRPKPRVLSLPGAAAGTYTLIVGNLGPRDESVSFQVVLTSSSAASNSVARVESGHGPGFLRRLPRR